MAVDIEKFGRDHWSTFGYIDTRTVDYSGVINRVHMRCNRDRHPLHAHLPSNGPPTRLKGGVELADHDDWDCADDLEAAGLLENVGTGMNRVYRLTPTGRVVADGLREHKRQDKGFATFDPAPFLPVVATG